MNILLRKNLPRIHQKTFLVQPFVSKHYFNQLGSATYSMTLKMARLRVMEDNYATQVSTALPNTVAMVHCKIMKATQKHFEKSHMMVSTSQAQFLHQLVKLLKPSKILEIGGFTGSSAIAMGSALGPEGKLTSLEMDLNAVNIAKEHIDASALRNKVDFKKGDALTSLLELSKQVPKPQFDLIFIDANKSGYINYYNTIMDNDLLSDDGLIVADNVLFFGQVHRCAGFKEPEQVEVPPYVENEAQSLVIFNEHVHQDPRTEVIVLPLYDGVSLIRKKK